MGSKNGKYLQNGKLFGGAPENKKCLELNFTPENTSKTSKSDHHQILGHTWAGLTPINYWTYIYTNISPCVCVCVVDLVLPSVTFRL